MKLDVISHKIKKLESDYQKLISKFRDSNILSSQLWLYTKSDKTEILQIWQEYISIFERFQFLIKKTKYRKYFIFIDHDKIVLKKYLLVSYFNAIIEFDTIAWVHREFICTLIRDNSQKSVADVTKFIYKPRHVNLINTPNIFLEVFSYAMKPKIKKLLKYSMVDVDSTHRLQADYNNIFYYGKYYFEKILFSIVKVVWNIIARTRFSFRKKGLITDKNIWEYLQIAKPGDICLTRWNWNASNISIPGFWKHMSMYLWTWEYIHKHYKLDIQLDKELNYMIEAVWDGVQIVDIQTMLEHNDYLWVFRTNFLDEKINRVIQNSIDNLGKWYDFIFSFYSDKNLVCSELIMKSYSRDFPEDTGIDIKLEHIGTWLSFPPNNFVSIAKAQPYLEPVFFIDSIEKTGKNFISTPSKLLKSRKRPRFSFLLK